eukprot:102257_1
MSVDITNRTYKKPRQRRTINNAIVNTQDVSIAPGAENINWRRIAKKKLTDRELRMLYKRQQVVDKLITAAIVQFIQRNSSTFDFNVCINIYKDKIRPKLINPQSAIMSLCAQSIANLLENWKGYSPISKDIPLFRDYFTASRHWFDSKKVRTIAIHFWIPSMQLIKEFAKRAAAQLFPNRQGVFQTMFAEYLNVLVLKCVFEGKIKFPNSGIMWLIPSTCFKVFLERYNHHLRINVTISNRVLRRECVECINSKHDVLKNAINQHVASLRAPTRKPVTPVPIQQNDEFQAARQYDNARMNRANNYSVSPSYTLHQNYPPAPRAPLTNPFGAMRRTYTSRVPPPVNQSTFSSYPVQRNYPPTNTPNASFQHTNTGANTNPFGPMRRSSYDPSVPCACCCHCCWCRSFRK